ncbi:MAG: HvfC/BufC family peptide modification chaperone [Thermoanaerobaculia bacterium]
MNGAGLPLARFQVWMQAVLVHPDGVDAGLRSRAARRIVPRAEPGAVVRAHGALAPVERLRIYASMYPLRTVEALRSDYPALASLLGEERFGALVADYVAANPSTSFTLARLGDRLPAFVAAWGPARGRGLRADVARLERAAAAVFDATDVELLDTATLAGALASEGESLRLAVAPAFALLAVRPGAVAVLDAVLDGTTPRAAAGRGLAQVAFYRRDFTVLRRALDPVPGRLLAALASGLPLGAALARASRGAKRPPAREVATWLAEWSALGAFARAGAGPGPRDAR